MVDPKGPRSTYRETITRPAASLPETKWTPLGSFPNVRGISCAWKHGASNGSREYTSSITRERADAAIAS